MSSSTTTSVNSWLVPYSGNLTTLYTFGEVPEATKCEFDWRSYSATARDYNFGYSFTTTLFNVTTTAWTSIESPRATILCDGHSRILEDDIFSFNTSIATLTTTAYSYGHSYTGPTPTCSINSVDCSRLSASYSSAWSARSQYRNHILTTTSGGSSDPLPCGEQCSEFWKNWSSSSWIFALAGDTCSTPPAPRMTDTCQGPCLINAQGARLIHFPVELSGGLCDNRSTITATPTIPGRPNTAVVNGTTFTSGFAYLSFDKIWAGSSSARWGGIAGTGCGPVHTNALISVPSSDLRSIGRIYHHRVTGIYPVNYGDFSGVYPPFSVYEQQAARYCDVNKPCGTYDDGQARSSCESSHRNWCSRYTVPYEPVGYEPLISLPPQVTTLDPIWSTCKPGQWGVGAIPVKLPVGSGAAKTTVMSVERATATPARPGRTVTFLQSTKTEGPSVPTITSDLSGVESEVEE